MSGFTLDMNDGPLNEGPVLGFWAGYSQSTIGWKPRPTVCRGHPYPVYRIWTTSAPVIQGCVWVCVAVLPITGPDQRGYVG